MKPLPHDRSSERLRNRIAQDLRKLARADFRTGQQRFFQHAVDSYGVRTQDLHALAREIYREVKPWPLAQRNRLMTELWKSHKLEGGALVCYVYRRFSKQCAACEFKLFERWIDRYVRNWAHTDGVASWLLAACIENEPELRFELRSWTKSPNRWKRRSAAVSLLLEAKKGRSTGVHLRNRRRAHRRPRRHGGEGRRLALEGDLSEAAQGDREVPHCRAAIAHPERPCATRPRK